MGPWSGWTSSRGKNSEKKTKKTKKTKKNEDNDEDNEEKRSNSETKDVENQLSIESERTHMGSEEEIGGIQRLTADKLTSEASEGTELVTALNMGFERIAVSREEEEETIVVSSQSGTTSPASEQSLDSTLVESAELERGKAALEGPRCPFCICPINGVYFPLVKCVGCNRIYHQECIQHDRCDRYHPFHGSSSPDTKLCDGCGCPDSDSFCVYVGYPGIMFHRRDQDPDFEEYFRTGRLEEAKSKNLWW